MGILHRGVLVGSLLFMGGEIAVSQEKRPPMIAEVCSGTVNHIKEALRHLGRDERGWHGAQTENFSIYGSSKEEIEKVGMTIEKIRSDVRLKWCKAVGEKWDQRCEVYLHPDGEQFARAAGIPKTNSGASVISMDSRRVVQRIIHVRMDAHGIHDSVLPHEVTHASMAGEFDGIYPPRWADEGMAVLAEPKASRDRHIKQLPNLRKQYGLYTAEQMLKMTDYPETKYVSLFYSQSVSLTDFLVQRKDPPTLIAFVREGISKGYAQSAKKHYGFESLDVLDRAWKDHAFGAEKVNEVGPSRLLNIRQRRR